MFELAGRRQRARRLIAALALLVGSAAPAFAVTDYYLDPDVATGTHVGTQANPFQTQAQMWSVVNPALASGDVRVYCSARAASSDTNQAWAVDIDVTQKTANPIGTLTLDGRSQWNSNDATPNWSAYAGSSKCAVLTFNAQNAGHIQYNNFTIDGFVVAPTSNAIKPIAQCGNNWLITNSDVSNASTGGISGFPNINIIPSADAIHEGSGSWCPASSNIRILNNHLHHSLGENIYVGGAGCTITDAALSSTNCNGFPSHSNILIEGNTFDNCGSQGQQGDCIDVKAAITYLTIRGNDISSNIAGSANNWRAIVMQGIQTDGTDQHIVVERNNFHDCISVDDGALAIVDSWGTPNGVEVRNNVFANTTGGFAVKVYTTQAIGVRLFNNTMYNGDSHAIDANLGSTLLVENNAIFSNNAGAAQNAFAGTVTADHNAFSNTWGGTCTTCVSGLTAADFVSPSGGDFHLVSGSIAKDAGTPQTSFSNDYAGGSRPFGAAWDIGAYEFGAGLKVLFVK